MDMELDDEASVPGEDVMDTVEAVLRETEFETEISQKDFQPLG